MKVVAALWDPDAEALHSPVLRERLAATGATRLQLNLDDEHVPPSVLRLQHLDESPTGVVSVGTDSETALPGVLLALAEVTGCLAAWEVEERVPLAPPAVPDSVRVDGLAQVALLRRPTGLQYDAWLAHWHGPHTEVAMRTQATFGYVQNRVLRAIGDAPDVAAIVEEIFPPAAMHDMHAFYGSGGDPAELDRRLTELLASCERMGADRDLDVLATSRYAWDLTGT